MKLQITHETCYDYVPPVEIAQHMAYLQPPDTAWQRLLDYRLSISPEPAQQNTTLDVYGNTRHFFSLQMPHSQLLVLSRSLVATRPAAPARSAACAALRPRAHALAGPHVLGDPDLLLTTGLRRVPDTAVGIPRRLLELQSAVVPVAGVDGPIAPGLALGDCVPVHRFGGSGTHPGTQTCGGPGDAQQCRGEIRANVSHAG